jgi:predicted DNA-binding protein with PD1-like motif
MQSKEEKGLIIARLFTDEDIFQSLKEICREHKVENAIVISAIGQVKKFTLGYFNGKEYLYHDYEKTHELVSISGMVSWSVEEADYKFHLHAAVGTEEKQVLGGHFTRGTAQSANEIVLLKTGLKVQRRKEGKAGMAGLYLE